MNHLIQFAALICILFKVVFAFNLSIIHFSDFHARYAPIDNESATCEGNNCIGGFSRLYATIKHIKQKNSNAVVLSAGDNFQGTLWYIVYKWNVTQHFINKLPLDAITLGNHEFDDGVNGLVPYLNHIRVPVVVANIDNIFVPSLYNLFQKSTIIERDGRKIGIIGVLTTTTQLTSQTGKLIFDDESESVNRESKRIEQFGVFTNIVLSHCGYEADIEIAKKSSSKISVIVGGHTDTFLYSTTPVPGPDKPSGPYPTVVLNKNGNKILIIHASAYTKYLGNITVIYDTFGNVVGWDGKPIFLKSTIFGDNDIETELNIWKKVVDLKGKKVVGSTLHSMQRKPCRSEECLLGNFVTDAMMFHYNRTGIQNNCKNATIAIIHGGGMRAGIEKGNITFNQLATAFPFQDTINMGNMRGEHIKEIFETFIDDNHLKFPHILQVSGIRVVFNTTNSEGSRVHSLEICCTSSEGVKCEDIIHREDYHVLLPTFLSDSNFNPLFKKYLKNKVIGDRDLDIYVQYLDLKSPLDQKIERRIQIVN